MKNTMIVVSAMFLAAACGTFGQPKLSADANLEAQIIALDKQGWQAWKDNNPAWFQENMAEELVSISSDGVSDKAQVVKGTPTDCKVRAYSLDNFKFVVLDKNAVLLTYTATQDAVCNGKQIPGSVRVAVNYVKRGDRWLEIMYMETH
ncbi:MAG: nuclear transport factor 2 family protein [Gemmatimonadales bacterium]